MLTHNYMLRQILQRALNNSRDEAVKNNSSVGKSISTLLEAYYKQRPDTLARSKLLLGYDRALESELVHLRALEMVKKGLALVLLVVMLALLTVYVLVSDLTVNLFVLPLVYTVGGCALVCGFMLGEYRYLNQITQELNELGQSKKDLKQFLCYIQGNKHNETILELKEWEAIEKEVMIWLS